MKINYFGVEFLYNNFTFKPHDMNEMSDLLNMDEYYYYATVRKIEKGVWDLLL